MSQQSKRKRSPPVIGGKQPLNTGAPFDLHPVMHTTSGSELEIEQRVLMKGNVMAARNSLFDFVQYNSWIKKSNYEGIFNAMFTIFVFMIIHKPIVSERNPNLLYR